MKKVKLAATAKRSTRSEDEVLASLRENIGYILGEELDEEELLMLTAGGMEDRLMEVLQRAKAKLLARPAERPVTAADEEQGKKARRDSTV